MSDLWKIISVIGVGGTIALFGIIFTIKGAVDQSQNNSAILSCENLQNFAKSETDKHWLACVEHGNKPWQCCRSCR
jgi:hypothetical protein